METTTLKGFSGLDYVTVTNIPIKKTDVGDAINMKPKELEKLVATSVIKNKVPIRGAEFRLIKSAIGLSLEDIADRLGASNSMVFKWAQEVETRIPVSYEMLFRLLAAEMLEVPIEPKISELRALNSSKELQINIDR